MKKTIDAIDFVFIGAGTYAYISSIPATGVGNKNCQAWENVNKHRSKDEGKCGIYKI